MSISVSRPSRASQALGTVALVSILALLGAPVTSQAQVMEDLEWRQSGDATILQIHFITPITYSGRSTQSRGHDLIQVFYEASNSRETVNWTFGQRLSLPWGRPGMQMSVTDEASGQGDRRRKLMIRLPEGLSSGVSIRNGRGGKTLEIVMPKIQFDANTPLVSAAQPVAGSAKTAKVSISLVSSTDPDIQAASQNNIPAALRGKPLEVVRRVVAGRQQYDLQMQGFDLDEARKVLPSLKTRFPDAAIRAQAIDDSKSTETSGDNAGKDPIGLGKAGKGPMTQEEVEARAAKLLNLAKKAEYSGKLDQAIDLLKTLLEMPPNVSSSEGQLLSGMVRIEMGDFRSGREELSLFIKTNPQSKEATKAKNLLAALGDESAPVIAKKKSETQSVTSGSLSAYFFGGESLVRTQEFADSPISALPTLLGDSAISTAPQKLWSTNLDLQMRKRDLTQDVRFIVRDAYQKDVVHGTDRNRLSALYWDYRSFEDGVAFKVGRQNPGGAGVIARFDGAMGSVNVAPKIRLSGVVGKPSDQLLDTSRYFYGAAIDADAITSTVSGSFFFNRQMIDGVVDRNAVGMDLRYLDGGFNASISADYDTLIKALNVGSAQGTWQSEQGTSVNFSFEHRMVSMLTLSNALYFTMPTQCPNGTAPSGTSYRRITDLLQCYNSLTDLRTQVHDITAIYTQGSVGVTTPLSARWQAGLNAGMTNIGEVAPVPDLLPNGTPSTGNLYSGGAQMIGNNLYSSRDSHVYSVTHQRGPHLQGTQLSYNNMTGIGESWQIEPSLRVYHQTESSGVDTSRITPGLRMSFKMTKRITVEADTSLEHSLVQTPSSANVAAGTSGTASSKRETSDSRNYSVGARFDF